LVPAAIAARKEVHETRSKVGERTFDEREEHPYTESNIGTYYLP
jgi:hypothetical protein